MSEIAEPASLTLDTVITHGDDQVFTIVDGEAVLMSVETGKYFKLDDIGTRIWALIEAPTAVGALCDQLTQEFSVERAACEADVLALLDRLLRNQLIRVAAGA